MTELQTGTWLGNYELLVELGRGGMATVWIARHHAESEVLAPGEARPLVALKIMLPELAQDTGFREMFLEEGRIVRSIQHENVVRVFEVGESQSLLYMAMEWVEGDSLRTVIKEARQRRAIPPEMAVRIMADTAAGLHAAHDLRGPNGELCGVVHCDISPHNILIGPTGKPKLVDFGVAQAATRTERGAGTDIKGKFGYMSPEQAQGRQFDRRSDLFSLGVVLFELTTGERLFRGADAASTLKRVIDGDMPLPSSVDPNYPPQLEAIVLRALAREPHQRFQTALELRQALEQFLIEQRIMVSEAGVGQLAKRVLGTRIQKRRQSIKSALAALDQSDGGVIAAARSTQVSQFSGSFDSQVLSAHLESATAPNALVPSKTGYLVAAAILVVAGIVSTLLLMRQPSVASARSRIIESGAHPDTPLPSAAPDRGRRPRSGAVPEGTDVESLPHETVPWKSAPGR